MKQQLSALAERLTSRFSLFVVGTLAASSAAGYVCFSIVDNQKYGGSKQQQQQEMHSEEGPTADMTTSTAEEVRLQAMIENARNSSVSENLENAFQAQERFMLPNRKHDTKPEFVKKIDKRSEEILLEEKQQRQKQAEKTTKFW